MILSMVGGIFMDVIKVYGKNRLNGDVTIQGCKNAVLPILAATLILGDECIIHNCPGLSDVMTSVSIINHSGAFATYNNGTVYINSENVSNCVIENDMMKKLRASIIFAAPLILKLGRAEFTMPGGCDIGTRPIDIHLASFEKMGVDVECSDGNVKCCAKKLIGADIYLPFPSVGATENIMILATGCSGVTRIYNAAREPEIEDLQNFLNHSGAIVCGAGTDVITITPAKKMHGCEYTIMSDRIEAITFLCACACSGGELAVDRVNCNHINNTLNLLEKMGVKIIRYPNSVKIFSNKVLKCPEFVITRPYPGFPTDAQSLFMSLMCHSQGAGIIVENIFENRLEHALELKKMGADITVMENRAFIKGSKLNGADTVARDLRSGAALVVAALGCEDLTTVANCCYIDRGYYDFTNKLLNIGAKVERIRECLTE